MNPARESVKRIGPAIAALLVSLLGVAPSARADLPVVYSGAAADAYGAAHVNDPPPGADEWSCHPPAAHPYPVVLVPGTIEGMSYNWYTLSPLLRNSGYCVFALNYGQQADHPVGLPGAVPANGTGEIAASAAELGAFVDRVLAATGASAVDIVGHSQGGMMPRYYLRFLGGAAKVHALVGLSPSNHGTTVGGLTKLFELAGAQGLGSAGLGLLCGTACEEQLAGSAFLRNLNAGGDTVPGVDYTVVETRYDEVVTPYQSAFLSGPEVDDIDLQAQCPLDASEHLATPFDHVALRDVLNALDPAQARAPVCGPVLPIVGG
jgi:triacylglycerol esterase/lipase EstA (alpha/beta hydrolase family)